MKRIIVMNNTTDDINVFLSTSNDSLIIKAKKQGEIFLNSSEKFTLLVREYTPKETIIETVLGILLAFFISIPLWYTYCVEDNSVKNTIKCSTIFKLDSILLENNNEIVVNESTEPLTAFEIILNKSNLRGNPVLCENEIEENLRSYNKSHNILWAFPIILVSILLICTLANQKIVGSLILLCVLLLIICISLQKKKQIKNDLLNIAQIIPEYQSKKQEQ